MRKSLFLICFLLLIVEFMSGCRYERIYYHNKNGHYRSARVRRNLPWFNSGEKGYNKPARNTMKFWDRGFR
jgi:hypothetical protein